MNSQTRVNMSECYLRSALVSQFSKYPVY